MLEQTFNFCIERQKMTVVILPTWFTRLDIRVRKTVLFEQPWIFEEQHPRAGIAVHAIHIAETEVIDLPLCCETAAFA